jgi:D-alanyl-lipoteichoic acid acyltransferase DltB (MBOAT superfamily)
MVIGYYALKNKFRWIWLLVGSYYFYYSWEPKLVLLLLASTIFDYYCGLKMDSSTKESTRKAYLIASILFNLSLLVFFKYLGFLTENTREIIRFFGIELANNENINATSQFSRIMIPVGISFYTFQTMSYCLDIYRKNLPAERHFGRYALYVSYFPQLVAGPIERATKLIPQLRKNVILNVETIRIGLMLMAWGFFMKMVVADRLGSYVDIVFSAPEKYAGLPLITGAYFFTFQIYFDFAAYSIIAIGAARVMGVDLMTNFNRPVYSKTASEFWTRWHISLMSWFRDYVYSPLVKRYHLKRYMALLIIFVLSGFWHGASWNFVIWGTMNGLFLLFEISTRKFREKKIRQMSGFISPVVFQFAWWFLSLNFLVFSLIFFRAQTIPGALNYIKNLLLINDLHVNVLKENYEFGISLVLILIVQTVNFFKPDHKVYELVINRQYYIRWSIYLAFIIIIVFFSVVRRNPFIYFQF